MTSTYVLLAEDNPHDVKLTEIAFRQNKIANDLVVVNDGVEAVEFLKACEAPPQVVLLDLKMPRMDGIEVLAWIRSSPRFKRLPVVILTTSTQENDLVRAYDNGANSYICKPVDFEQFSQAVRELGLYWLILNKTAT